ncbi:MAG TPA: hypothetical protein DIT07_02655 [Sphingobacteriaceae bacterium]|nr:hypothetical protein [Sphingobacteriaceae bacterium]
MVKYLNKTISHDPQKTFIVKKTAELYGVSTSLIYKILSGDRENDEIFMTYMELQEGIDALIQENEMLQEVKKLLPFQ